MTKSRGAATAWVMVATATLWGCGGGEPTESGSSVVATVGDEAITADDVIERLRSEQYDLLRGTIDAMASEKVVEVEAAARDLDVEELFRLEVSAKITLPDPKQIEQFYQASKDGPAMRGKTLEDARPQIANFLQQQKMLDRRNAYVAELKREAGIRVNVQPERVDLQIPAGTLTRGSEDAPLTLVEFADFQCPACRRAYGDVERILSEYGDKINYAFLDYPLVIHPRAVPASEAALCAADQDRYWDYHQHLMLFTGALDDKGLVARAKDLEMDVDKFQACYLARTHTDAVKSSFQVARGLGVNSTPTFFINGRKIVGAPPYETFKEIVEEELARVAGGGDSGEGEG